MPASSTKEGAESSLPRVAGGFRLLRELGRGGMGVVYHAEELSSGRAVALKVLAGGEDVSDEAFERFRRESRMAASISDSRCVFVYGAHQVDGRPAIAMELCPGETLEHRLGKGVPVPVETAVRWTLEILEGLEAAHRAGVVHRDVKPSNCFITQDDRVKVGDFGLSRSLDTDIRLTQSGAFLGSPLYASPEQVRGRDTDLRSDIYSCGATLYALLGGRAPYHGSNIGEVLARILSESPPPIRSLRPDVPPELEKVVARAMERDPERRFQDHAAFRAALGPFVASEIVPAGRIRRVVAYVLDSMLTTGIVTTTVFLGASQGAEWMAMDPDRPGRFKSLAFTLFASALPFVYFALSEGLFGASPGKWVLGQRVVDARTGRTSLPRGILRALVFFTSTFTSLTFFHYAALSQRAFSVLVNVAGLANYSIMASTMRRRNGFRGLHEFASGTRTVQVRSPFARIQESRPVPVQASTRAEGWPADLGAYVIESRLGETPTGVLLQGVDQSLGRAVWICARKGAPATVSEERRALARPGRLRWLDATRQGEFLFEVFEAPGGASLSDCVAQGASFDWSTARRVLADLAGELAHASDAVCIEQVWIDRTWNVRLLDEPIGRQGSAWRSPLELLSDAARLVLDDRLLPVAAEPVVKKLLGGGGTYASLADARRELEELAQRPTRLTPAVRAGQIAVSAIAPTMILSIIALSLFALADPIQSFVESIRCIEQLRAQDANPPPAERMDDDDRKAREIVISSAQGTAWAANFNSRLEPEQLAIERRAVAAHPAPAADEIAWARERMSARPFKEGEGASATNIDIGPGAKISVTPDTNGGAKPGAKEGLRDVRWKLIPIFITTAIGAWGVLSTILALAFRGGLSLKLFGMGVRTTRGEMASRLRCAWRSLIVWIPLTLLYGTGAWLGNHGHFAIGSSLVLAAAAVHAGLVAYAVANPSRGIQDRLAGTRLVPR
ncbi:MAG TPA: protein kinase [Planctomycetota bacterium]|jgi:uncharacterized RDD family membrane protein YckC|nr:protein kinase [Planctomycetota bacterium]